MPVSEIKIKAPFGIVTITVPDFSMAPRFYLDGLGADKENNTRLITGTIAKASAAGGGVVIIPEGEWPVKTIHFKSNVNLHLNKGAVLLFSEDPADYLPAVHTTWEGMECYN